ncbi:MAG: DUF456 family protein [Planctomycetes bacterium]|nr:DUF456 family protein [Planctomycetota bacterium]
MLWVAVISVFFAGLIGLVLSLLTLPGIWLPIVVALLFQWVRPDTFPWSAIGVACAVGILAELLELVASAAGAARAGGTKRAAAGAIVGTVVGAVAGSLIPLFPISTILGAVAGAGIGAGLMDRSRVGRSWKESANVATGAAAARGIAIVLKGVFGAIIALVLIVGAIAHAW